MDHLYIEILEQSALLLSWGREGKKYKGPGWGKVKSRMTRTTHPHPSFPAPGCKILIFSLNEPPGNCVKSPSPHPNCSHPHVMFTFARKVGKARNPVISLSIGGGGRGNKSTDLRDLSRGWNYIHIKKNPSHFT